MSNALQLVEHIRLCTSSPQAFLDQIPPLPTRAEAFEEQRKKEHEGTEQLKGWESVVSVLNVF